MNKKVLFITQAGVIAALYVVLTFIANALGLASGDVQVRFSEALTILPFFTPAAIPGLYVGCLLSNILCGCIIWDVIFGSLATLLGAIGTYLIRKKAPEWCACIPPILANMLIIPFILVYAYGVPGIASVFGLELKGIPVLICMLTVGIGEIISCGILGTLLLKVLKKYRRQLFPNS